MMILLKLMTSRIVVTGGFGTRWLTDLINNIVKEGCIADDWRKSILLPVYRGNVYAVHTKLLGYWSSW